MSFATVVAKFASSPNANANSLRVSSAAGAESTKLAIAVLHAVATKAVEATIVELVPAVAVGTVGFPVKDGLARGAFALKVVSKSVIFDVANVGISPGTRSLKPGAALLPELGPAYILLAAYVPERLAAFPVVFWFHVGIAPVKPV